MIIMNIMHFASCEKNFVSEKNLNEFSEKVDISVFSICGCKEIHQRDERMPKVFSTLRLALDRW